MLVFKHVWPVTSGEADPAERWLLLAEDLLKAISLLPFARIRFNLDVDEVVTASDASEHGGGVCASVGPTPEGRARLWEGELRVKRPVNDELLLLELFAGIGAGRRALQLLGVTPGTHVVVEIDESATAVLMGNYPEARHWPDIRTFDSAKLAELCADNPHITRILVLGAFPCQDV